MNIENQKDKPTWEGLEQYFAVEVIEQSKRNAKHWFIVFLVTLAALIGTNAAWLYTAGTYDYVSQDGTGLNNINTGTQGDLENNLFCPISTPFCLISFAKSPIRIDV